MPDVMGSLLGGLTDLFGRHPGKEYEGLYKGIADQYGGMNPNLNAEQMGQDAPTRDATLDAMGEYANIAKSGGLDAIGRSQIAEANAATGSQANAMNNAIGNRARSTGNVGSGVSY